MQDGIESRTLVGLAEVILSLLLEGRDQVGHGCHCFVVWGASIAFKIGLGKTYDRFQL